MNSTTLILFLGRHLDLDDVPSRCEAELSLHIDLISMIYEAELCLLETKAANEAHQGNKAPSLACHLFRRGVSIVSCFKALNFLLSSPCISQLVGQLFRNRASSKVLSLCRAEFRSGSLPNRFTAS